MHSITCYRNAFIVNSPVYWISPGPGLCVKVSTFTPLPVDAQADVRNSTVVSAVYDLTDDDIMQPALSYATKLEAVGYKPLWLPSEITAGDGVKIFYAEHRLHPTAQLTDCPLVWFTLGDHEDGALPVLAHRWRPGPPESRSQQHTPASYEVINTGRSYTPDTDANGARALTAFFRLLAELRSTRT